LAFLPCPVSTGIAATQIAPRLAARMGTGRVISLGLLVAAAGLVVLAQLGAHSSYVDHAFPGMVLMSLGMGCVVPMSMATATHGVHPTHAGVAGATVNTMQQVGGSLGTALLSTIAVSATTHALAGSPHTARFAAQAAAHGYTTAFWCSAGLLAASALLCGALMRPPDQPAADANAAAQPVSAH
jgi:MFS family permease